MSLTVEELVGLAGDRCDPDEVVMMLGISSAELLHRFSDKVEENLDSIINYLGIGEDLEHVDMAYQSEEE